MDHITQFMLIIIIVINSYYWLLIVIKQTTLSFSLKPVKHTTTPSIIKEYNGLFLLRRGYSNKSYYGNVQQPLLLLLVLPFLVEQNYTHMVDQ